VEEPGWEIVVMSLGGTGLRRLTSNSYLDTDARWNNNINIVYVSGSSHRTSEARLSCDDCWDKGPTKLLRSVGLGWDRECSTARICQGRGEER